MSVQRTTPIHAEQVRIATHAPSPRWLPGLQMPCQHMHWKHVHMLHVHVLHACAACCGPRSPNGSDAVKSTRGACIHVHTCHRQKPGSHLCPSAAASRSDVCQECRRLPGQILQRREGLQHLMCLLLEGMGHPASHLRIIDPLSRAASQHEAEENKKQARTNPRGDADQL